MFLNLICGSGESGVPKKLQVFGVVVPDAKVLKPARKRNIFFDKIRFSI